MTCSPCIVSDFPDISHEWQYDFNHTKSGVVTYGETKPVHFEVMKEREWILGDGPVDEHL